VAILRHNWRRKWSYTAVTTITGSWALTST
jgi:hypothetical protein